MTAKPVQSHVWAGVWARLRALAGTSVALALLADPAPVTMIPVTTLRDEVAK